MMRLLALATALLIPMTAQAQQSADAVIDAIKAADDGEWDVAYLLAGPDDALARDLVTWMRLRAGDGTFDDYRAFATQRPDWPGLDRLRARGEAAIAKGHDPAQVLNWFEGHTPETGEGAVRLAEALITSGKPDDANVVLRDAWLTLGLDNSGHAALMAAFPDILAPFHAARTDAMLWRWRTADADRMLPLLDADTRALATARIAYIRKTGKEAAALAAVPTDLISDPGLAYDRYNWLADKGRNSDAVAILQARSTSAAALGDPFRWSGWRRSLARWEMREGNARLAYDLAAHHFLTEGSAFADLEWLAGYIALTYLDDPQSALVHFRAAEADVESPISQGRAGYWIARTYEVLGDANAAARAYQAASVHQTGFYGLLAAEKLGLSLNPALTGAEDFGDWQQAAFLRDDLPRAALALLDAGERGLAVLFFAELGKTLDRTELGQLGALLAARDEAYYEVLLGKTAVTRGIVVPSIYFPLHDLSQMDLPVPPELALSIARRESEFNAGVGSPVGALGLMQLMPGTAQEVAGLLDLPYSKPRLTADWAYNATLGSQYLAMLIEEFGYSPVMIAAGYNAGPSRPKIWMDARGDPRLGEVDVIDWIEHIPFRETRNYVMRVAESIPIYQARLTGEVGPIQFTALLNGTKPLVRPAARPVAQVADVGTSNAPVTPAIAAPATPESPAPVPGVRPIARPGG